MDIYSKGIGRRTIKVAICCDEFAKMHIMRKDYKQAYEMLTMSIKIKEDIFRYKPECRELKKTRVLIQGL